ncbi:MAG: class I SAM-dependent methyltransferase [Mariprofundaceae bacterium]
MAHHKAFSKQRWDNAQKAELTLLGLTQHQHANIKQLTQEAKQCYLPFINPFTQDLQADSHILDIGCGPACISQFIPIGHKTFLDPLLDNFRRAWPGSLPKGKFITAMAEQVKRPDASFDMILCMKTLSHSHNPELILHEVERLLKSNGTFILSVDLWPTFFARLHYFTANFFPQWTLKNRLYCYTKQGIENTLKRYFNIISVQAIPSGTGHKALKKEYFYVCKLKGKA